MDASGGALHADSGGASHADAEGHPKTDASSANAGTSVAASMTGRLPALHIAAKKDDVHTAALLLQAMPRSPHPLGPVSSPSLLSILRHFLYFSPFSLISPHLPILSLVLPFFNLSSRSVLVSCLTMQGLYSLLQLIGQLVSSQNGSLFLIVALGTVPFRPLTSSCGLLSCFVVLSLFCFCA